MAYDGVLCDIRKCIGLAVPARMPVIALTEEFDVGQAGLTYEEYAATSDNVARVHIRGIETFDYDWACIYIDDCLEFEPLGVKTVGSGNIPKSVSEFIPATRERLHSLKAPDPEEDGRMPIQLEGIRRVRQIFDDTVLICGRAPSPFSAATLLFGIEPVMLLMYDDPQLLGEIMEFLLDVEEIYAKAQIDAGAHALWAGDCSASSRFLSLEHFKRFVMKPTVEHLARLKNTGALTIYFGAEKEVEHLKTTAELGADIIGLSENADLPACKEAVGDRICLMGNLDPINTMLNGTPSMVEAEVNRIISAVSRQGGHLFNTGEGVPSATPKENVQTLVEALRRSW